jgi:hypothetical protein
MSTQKVEVKKISLEQFISDHHQMFTVIGVFGGLTALFAKLENASYLAFFSFLMFILLDVDIWIRFPKSEEASLSLKIFEALSQLYVVLIGIYLVQTYPNFVGPLLPLLFTLIFSGIFFFIFNRFKLFEPIRKISPTIGAHRFIVRIVIGMAIVIGLFILSLALGTLVATLIKNYFQYPPTA